SWPPRTASRSRCATSSGLRLTSSRRWESSWSRPTSSTISRWRGGEGVPSPGLERPGLGTPGGRSDDSGVQERNVEENSERATRADGSPGAAPRPDETRREVERGLRFAHVMLAVNQEQGSEAVAYVQALADLLVQKGIIRHEELEAPL